VVTQIPSGALGYSLAVGIDDLYFTTADTLYSCPKTGCSKPTTLVTGLAGPGAIAYDAVTARIYVADTNHDSMNAYATSGAVVFQDVVQYAHPTALTMDATYLYWGIPGGVLRMTRDGTSTLQIVSGIPSQITWLIVDPPSSRLFGAMTTNSALIFTAPIDGGANWEAFAGTGTIPQPYPMQVLLQAGQVYWLNSGVQPQGSDGGIYECPSAGCASPQAVPGTGLTYGSCFFIDSTSVTYVGGGNLLRCPLAGCPAGPAVLATGIYAGTAEACGEDAASYYFLPDEGPPNLLRVPK
jgi:hypothetical protein